MRNYRHVRANISIKIHQRHNLYMKKSIYNFFSWSQLKFTARCVNIILSGVFPAVYFLFLFPATDSFRRYTRIIVRCTRVWDFSCTCTWALFRFAFPLREIFRGRAFSPAFVCLLMAELCGKVDPLRFVCSIIICELRVFSERFYALVYVFDMKNCSVELPHYKNEVSYM